MRPFEDTLQFTGRVSRDVQPRSPHPGSLVIKFPLSHECMRYRIYTHQYTIWPRRNNRSPFSTYTGQYLGKGQSDFVESGEQNLFVGPGKSSISPFVLFFRSFLGEWRKLQTAILFALRTVILVHLLSQSTLDE